MGEVTKWDMADYLGTPEDIEDHLNAWLEDCDAQELAYLLGCIARFEGMTKIAIRTGLNRVSLYTSLGEGGNPSLDTVMRLLDALGYRFRVERKPREAVTA